MILRTLLLQQLVTLLINAQIPQQPVVTTSSACLNGCFQDGSLIFAANNLRNFEKIIVNVEQFCNVYEQLIRCAAACSESDRDELARRISLSEYICKDKIEEFRLVKECVQSQDIETVNHCSNDCGHAHDATIQLDSSPSAAVNPFAFFDSISPVCRILECIVKCSIAESNKKCAGSGDIFRDIGSKQVFDASERLHDEMANSSSPVAAQLAKIYLEALPEQCAYIVDPFKFNTLFAEHEEDLGSEMVTQTASMEDFNVLPTTTTLASILLHQTTTTIATFVFEPLNEPDIPTGPPSFEPFSEETPHEIDSAIAQPELPVQIQFQAIPNQSNVEHVGDVDEPAAAELFPPITMAPDWQEYLSSTTNRTSLESGQTSASVTSASTTTTSISSSAVSSADSEATSETTEKTTTATSMTTTTERSGEDDISLDSSATQEADRTIMVVNDDAEILTNQVHDHQNGGPTKQQKQSPKNKARSVMQTNSLLYVTVYVLLITFTAVIF